MAHEPAPKRSFFGSGGGTWWKGNLHTHTLWSDGDDYPEMVIDWYQKRGYNFLALSDHNIIQDREKWISISANKSSQLAFKNYKDRFGKDVVTREQEGQTQVRLKTLEEFQPLFEKPGKFLLIPSEEISAHHEKLPIHINATNLRELIEPRTGKSVYEVMQNNIDAILAQRQRTGQAILPHLNHPNFHYAVTAEDLMRVKGENFFEVYNGHPHVNNYGDTNHLGTEEMWDLMLASRLTVLKMEPIYGIAVDDSHHYHEFSPSKSNSGRGWIMVRSKKLDAESLIHAMEAGDFYASSGVKLKDVIRKKDQLTVRVDADKGVDYTIRFIGTYQDILIPGEKGQLMVDKTKTGQVLLEEKGTTATYKFKGNELYVRAVVTSSRPMPNAVVAGEMEKAWVQPLVPPAK
ncbi:MAG: PHP domain-containing protein [Verrucomicrobiales bacterium]